MRGAPARAIQELAGHQDRSTTQRYMHLSPAALDAAIGSSTARGRRPAVSATGVLAEAAGVEPVDPPLHKSLQPRDFWC